MSISDVERPRTGPDGLPEELRPVDDVGDPPATGLRRIGERPSTWQYLKDVWAHREFALALTMGELRSQNQDTLLGQAWHLLNPLLLVAVYWLIFGVVLDITRGGVDNYVGFLIVGVITFNFTRTAVTSGARVIVKNRSLVQSISFPRAVLPLAAMMEEAASQLIAAGVMVVLLLMTGVVPSVTWPLLVPILVLQFVFSLGAAMTTARLTFHFRDVQQLLPYIMRILFYASGVLFPIEERLIPSATVRLVLQLNPLNAFVTAARDVMMFETFDPFTWTVMIGWTLATGVFGFVFFRRAETEYSRV